MGTPYRILHVEDSPTQRILIQDALETAGWQVTSVENAHQALAELNQHLPDLVLVDYILPGMRGDELCRRIRMNLNTRAVPIVMLTDANELQIESLGLDSGADDYVAKSADPTSLLVRIRSLLGRTPVENEILEQPGLRQARLLLIDDSSTYLTALSDQLLSEGYLPDVAHGGAEGLEAAQRSAYDAILVDLIMPGMDGLEVCRRLNQSRTSSGDNFVILILTAREGKDDMTRGLEAGADDFVTKSNEMSVLKARIRALLRRKFFQEENLRILEALKAKELEAVQARALAEARAAMAAELERANNELQASNRKLNATQRHLEEVNRELEAFSYSVSHDLRAPLRAISAFTGVVLQKHSSQLPDEAQQMLGRVAQSVTRMGQLIDDLLRLARLGTAQVVRRPVPVAALVQEVAAELGSTDVIVGELPDCMGDQALLRQVLVNLLSNAVKFTRHQVSPRIEVGGQVGADEVVYFVRDNGVGYDPEHADKLFGVFQRMHRDDEFEGTGIGLSISRRIVERHGGRIWAESALGKGATFFFALPQD